MQSVPPTAYPFTNISAYGPYVNPYQWTGTGPDYNNSALAAQYAAWPNLLTNLHHSAHGGGAPMFGYPPYDPAQSAAIAKDEDSSSSVEEKTGEGGNADEDEEDRSYEVKNKASSSKSTKGTYKGKSTKNKKKSKKKKTSKPKYESVEQEISEEYHDDEPSEKDDDEGELVNNWYKQKYI
jgi:hypothetical protein